ncbi:MAG TPA: DUF4236 domain-containing protein [Rhizomicrobium sp.]|nr:DUF4236 domain-containing protein [Rhizomicrobium sp.]
MFKGLRFQKRISLLPGLRINLSKSGASASLGPRGADVNIGPHGVTTNAGIPGTGLSYRQKAGGGKTWLAVLALVGGLGVWAFQHMGKVEKAAAIVTAAASQGAFPAPVNTAVPGLRYVHRAGSVLRAEPRASAESLKKESKGAQVTLISQSDGWAQVRDSDLTGYMRSSVLGAEPPR